MDSLYPEVGDVVTMNNATADYYVVVMAEEGNKLLVPLRSRRRPGRGREPEVQDWEQAGLPSKHWFNTATQRQLTSWANITDVPGHLSNRDLYTALRVARLRR